MSQIANNTREQAMLDDFPRAIDDAIHGLEKKLSHLILSVDGPS